MCLCVCVCVCVCVPVNECEHECASQRGSLCHRLYLSLRVQERACTYECRYVYVSCVCKMQGECHIRAAYIQCLCNMQGESHIPASKLSQYSRIQPNQIVKTKAKRCGTRNAEHTSRTQRTRKRSKRRRDRRVKRGRRLGARRQKRKKNGS